ncbi:geranylgeranyl pyrophosphate synthetase [Apiospora arundinis]
MLMPGMPPRWTPLSQPMELAEDSGDYYRDRNAARYPTHPMEPAVVAALSDAPSQCDSAEVDLVACSSTLGNLVRFLRGEQKPFRILVEEIGDTMFFIRREKSPTEKIPDVRGFGHTFPEHYTTWDQSVKSSTSHQRLLSYSFGGMRCFVRFEADGYLPAAKVSPPTRQTNAKAQRTATATDFNDLLSRLESTTVDTKETPVATAAEGLEIKNAGAKVDQSQIFDLKTRSFRRKFNQDTLSDELPRLWVSQIPNFVLAYHTNGVFDDIRVQDVRAAVAAWEAQQRPVLARLAALLHCIRALVWQNPARRLELCHAADRPGILQVRQQLPDAGDALSAEVKARWLSAAGVQEEKDDGASVGSDTDSDSEISFGVHDGEEDFTDCSGACGYCGHCASVKKA